MKYALLVPLFYFTLLCAPVIGIALSIALFVPKRVWTTPIRIGAGSGD